MSRQTVPAPVTIREATPADLDVITQFNVRMANETRLWDAVHAATTYLGVLAGRKVVFVFTDGYDTVWMLDHLSGEVFGGDRMLECWTLVGALAAATTTIGLGTMVANAANRPPAVLAAAAASAQEISAGRFHLGVGAGSAPGTRWAKEHEVTGMELEPGQSVRRQASSILVSDER